MTLEGGQNLNFAIPSNYLKELMARSGGAKLLSQGEQSISAETFDMGTHEVRPRVISGSDCSV